MGSFITVAALPDSTTSRSPYLMLAVGMNVRNPANFAPFCNGANVRILKDISA